MTQTPKGFRFPRHSRVLRGREFRWVFRGGRRVTTPEIQFVARGNERGYSRLGLAVSRRVSKRAVDRNRIKRLLREVFRLHRAVLPGPFDIVAIPRSSAIGITYGGVREIFLGLADELRRPRVSSRRSRRGERGRPRRPRDSRTTPPPAARPRAERGATGDAPAGRSDDHGQ